MRTPPKPRKRRIALRAGATANAIPTASNAAAANARTSVRRRRPAEERRAFARSRGSANVGVGGHSTVAPTERIARSSSDIQLPQAVERPCGARLDSAAAHASRRSRLLLGQIEEIAADEHEPRLVGQLVEDPKQPPTLLCREKRLVGRRRLHGARGLRSRAQREPCAPAGGATTVARAVRDDAEQPRAKGRSRPEP